MEKPTVDNCERKITSGGTKYNTFHQNTIQIKSLVRCTKTSAYFDIFNIILKS